MMYCGAECNVKILISHTQRLVSHIVEVDCYIEDVYLLSQRQITSFKVGKLQLKFRYGLKKDIQKEP